MKIKRVAIVGGGTAGWLAANHIGLELCKDPEIELTVIESKDIPTIGVGEGTVPYIIKGLKRFGISEAELLVSCDATFKQGIKFINWLDKLPGRENYYYHPFDSPYPGGFDVNNYWLNGQRSRPYSDVGIQAKLAELNLAPKKKSTREYDGELTYAYHFNAQKFAALLAKNAQSKFNVKHKIATVLGASKDTEGFIKGLETSEGQQLYYDFYIDCSGFSSILLDKEMGSTFLDMSEQLLIDKALVQQVPLEESAKIQPYTSATAHKAGWIWDIPLTTRRGTGFVYSSQHMSEQDALKSYSDYLNIPVDSLSPRKLDMKIGYREQFWVKNCVGLGLTQGFVEPLEATSILIADFSAEMLAKNFPKKRQEIQKYSPYYNRVIKYVWDQTIDFIQLHYLLSDRQDSQFWIDVKKTPIRSELKERLDMFSLKAPSQFDFFSRFDLFDHKNYLYVLYGMEFATQIPLLCAQEKKESMALFKQNGMLINIAKEQLLDHRKWLQDLKNITQS